MEVVALQLGLGPVDDAHGALEPRWRQLGAYFLARRLAEMQQEGADARLVAQPLVALGVRRTESHHPHRAVPIVRRGDRSMVGAEADQGGRVAEPLPAQLSQVQLAARAHLGRPRVAEV